MAFRGKTFDDIHEELVRIRQLLQAMAGVQEQQLQANLEACRLLRKTAGVTTGEQVAVTIAGKAPTPRRDRGQPVDWGTQP